MIRKLSQVLKEEGARRYLKNTGWLVGEKLLRLTLGLFVSVWVARYLGPENFGVFSYIQSFVGLFIVVATLGLDGVVVRELVKTPNKVKELVGTAFFMRIIGFVLLMAILLIAINFTSNSHDENIYIIIFACSALFQSFNVIDFYFQSKVHSKYVVYANIISLVTSSLAKIILILFKAPLFAFVLVFVLDSFLLAINLIIQYYRNGSNLLNWVYNKIDAKKLISDSWPLILSGIVIAVYMKIDQVMIKEMLGSKDVGQYAAAVKLSEAWYFIPMVICNSLFPAIVNAKATNFNLYERRMRNLYGFLVWGSISVAVLTTILGDWGVQLLYGNSYSGTASVLKIHIWAGIFVGLGVASSKWYITENLQKYSFYRTLLGAVVNVTLNLILIPRYGIVGAAYATLIAQFCASYFFNLFTKITYSNFKLQSAALIAPYEFYNFIKKR